MSTDERLTLDEVREAILYTLDGLASPDGTIQADPATATEEIMAKLAKPMPELPTGFPFHE